MYDKRGGVNQRSTGNQVCILLHTQTDQWRKGVITQVVSLNKCDLFLDVLVIRMKQLDYCKTVQENSNCCVRDCGEDLIKIQLIRFSLNQGYNIHWNFHVFSILQQHIDSKKKTGWQLLQSTDIRTHCLNVKMHFYNRNHLVSRTKTLAKLTKINK